MSKSFLEFRRSTAQTPDWLAPVAAGVVSAIFFAVTLQTFINGSSHAYATDVGELQNALPRWGTIHFSGYPLYSITGSFLVTVLRWVGVPPAMGSSLVSLLWGSVTAVLVAWLALELGARRLAAFLGAIVFSVSTSMWIDSSLAEVHSMSMMLMAAILLFAVRFDRNGRWRDLLLLTFFLSQGVFHGRAIMGLIPAVFLLVLPRWRMIWRHVPTLLAISLLGPLLYLYLPLREWMGADWTFGNTSTWEGFTRMFLNIKAGRYASVSTESWGWSERWRMLRDVLRDDLPFFLLIPGLMGLFFIDRQRWDRWRYAAAFLLAWLPFAVVPLFVYAGFVGDAILAIKLPVPMLAGVGIALLISWLQRWQTAVGRVALAAVVVAILFTAWRNYPTVVAITKDRSVEETIAIADQAAAPNEPTVLMILWGHDYWGAAYAQAYRHQLADVMLVDHNADFGELVIEQDRRLLTLSKTFYLRTEQFWEEKLGQSVYLDNYAPGLIEIRTEPRMADVPDDAFQVNDSLAIADVDVAQREDAYQLSIHWLADAVPQRDYHVAVHLVAKEAPTGPEDILDQADSVHPVDGWYPTTAWEEGQIVLDAYELRKPAETTAAAVRITAYHVDEDGNFVNGNWLTLPLGE